MEHIFVLATYTHSPIQYGQRPQDSRFLLVLLFAKNTVPDDSDYMLYSFDVQGCNSFPIGHRDPSGVIETETNARVNYEYQDHKNISSSFL